MSKTVTIKKPPMVGQPNYIQPSPIMTTNTSGVSTQAPQQSTNPYFKPVDTNEYVNALTSSKDNQKTMYDLYYNQSMFDMNAQQPLIKEAYDNARGQTYAGSRVSAIGNNEQLANMGVAGNMYASPKSGYSETARVRQDTQLQGDLNALSREQRGAVQSLQQAMQQAQMERAGAMAGIEGQYANNLAEYQHWAEQENYQRQLTADQQLMQEEQRQVPYIQGIIESGANLSKEQEALLNKHTGMSAEEYKNVYDAQREREKEDLYNTNYFELITGYNQGYATIDDAISYRDSGMISDAQFKKFEDRYKAEVGTKLTSQLSEVMGMPITEEFTPDTKDAIILDTLAQIDANVEKGYVEEAERQKAYYDVYQETVNAVTTKEEYDIAKTSLNSVKDKLGKEYYDNLIKQLEKYYKDTIEPKSNVEFSFSGATSGTKEIPKVDLIDTGKNVIDWAKDKIIKKPGGNRSR